MSIEFHCHTLFSVDGWGTPENVVEAAAARGVTAMAITEHNNLASFSRAAIHAAKHGIRYFSGVEFDATWKGDQLHFLAFGVDPHNAALGELCQRHLDVYVRLNDLVFDALAEHGLSFSKEELQADYSTRYPTHPSPTPNIWQLRDSFVRAGNFQDPAEGERYFKSIVRKVRKQNDSAPEAIASFEEVKKIVHQSGGVLLLAHVAKYMAGNGSGQIELINHLLDQGMDGFELYHPKNCAEAHFDQLQAVADRRQCLISGGSDSHVAPGSIGQCGAPDSVAARLMKVIKPSI